MHLLQQQESLDTVASLFDHLPMGVQIALAGRSVRGIPLARLRAHGQLEELGADALALDEEESAVVLAAAGVQLTEDEVADVRQATEGWPAGVYFASLSIEASGGHERTGRPFSGDDRVVRDYLALELLSNLSAPEIRFVTRTAALDQMCGPLCDAVLGETGSAEMLESLEQASLFVVPLDRQRRWYRYHRLCHQMLRSELDRREPGAARERAAEGSRMVRGAGPARGGALVCGRGRRRGSHRVAGGQSSSCRCTRAARSRPSSAG